MGVRSLSMHLSAIGTRLAQLREQGLLREADDRGVRQELFAAFGEQFLDACSNDYLDLAGADVSRETPAQPGAAVGSGASRLVFGTHPEHRKLERTTADWLGYESALLFACGYSANLGALGCLLSEEDAVFSDELNHASIIDGIRLSRARPVVFPHLDLGTLEAQLAQAGGAPARWVVVESYYSMDGDGPDLRALRALCDRYDAHLYVDEAHSVGTFGWRGRGLGAEAGVQADVLMAGLGKAVGGQGACVLGSTDLRLWLWNKARSFVFSTAPSPWLSARVTDQIGRTQDAETARARLMDHAQQLRRALLEQGVETVPGSFGPIVSVVVGGAEQAMACAAQLRAVGILAQAIRPPTVPVGRSRLRLVLRAGMNKDQVQRLADAVATAIQPAQRSLA